MSAEDGCDPEHRFLNHYRCEECGEEWTDEWSCQCDDSCPECGARDMSPYQSDEIDGDAP
jgi:predicted  nucleic acid-binding Zn-ribbon protein